MSSLRNAVSRRPHKERSQPESRQKWGLLEKHKDYTLRAQDYNTKKRKLKILSQKARDRHPDEFAFGMLSTRQGQHTGQKPHQNRLSHDAVKLLKTQDAGYLRTAAAQTRKELDRANQEIEIDDVSTDQQEGRGKKILFDEDGNPPSKKAKQSRRSALEELDDENINTAVSKAMNGDTSHTHESEEEQAVAKPKSKKQRERELNARERLQRELQRRKRLREARAKKLELLKKRQRDIQAAADELELQRAKMAKVVGGVNKNGVKFKIRERKK